VEAMLLEAVGDTAKGRGRSGRSCGPQR
jgi:hypothetical protein